MLYSNNTHDIIIIIKINYRCIIVSIPYSTTDTVIATS